ncbi:MAG: flagellar basal-body rod protein FlgF [Bdellovibrionales bacterium]|nr:flagellar basal-body rod protein FlgF [Bdellovibrionales bacterium]
MSTKGIYTAVSGAIAQSQKLDTIANNMANVNTTGFKKDSQVFQEYLTAYEKQQDVLEVPRVPASIDSFYNMQGGDKAYVDSAGSYTSFEQGPIKNTGNDMDLALEGRAFFEILTADGVRFSRNGAFVIDQQGRLATKEGHLVLSEGQNQPLEDRVIQFGGNGRITIGPDGEIFQGQDAVGKLGIVNVDNLQALKKEGSSLFSLKENLQAQVAPAENFKVHQGAVEGSNVNVVKEMTDMIQTTRLFELTQKAIQAYDKMDQIVSNDLVKD